MTILDHYIKIRDVRGNKGLSRLFQSKKKKKFEIHYELFFTNPTSPSKQSSQPYLLSQTMSHLSSKLTYKIPYITNDY